MNTSQRQPLLQSSLFRWLLSFSWMAVIFGFSAQSHSGEITQRYFGLWNFLVRKCAHVAEYAVLFLLIRWACAAIFTRSASTSQKSATAVAFTIAACFALTDEMHQLHVAGRTSSLADVLIDLLGVSIACIGWTMVTKAKSKKGST